VKKLILLLLVSSLYADTVCTFNGSDIHSEHKQITYTMTCGIKECVLTPDKKGDIFYVSTQVTQDKTLRFCVYMKRFIKNASKER